MPTDSCFFGQNSACISVYFMKFIELYIYLCVPFYICIIIHNKKFKCHTENSFRCLSKYTNDHFCFFVVSIFYFLFACNFNVKAKEATTDIFVKATDQ